MSNDPQNSNQLGPLVLEQQGTHATAWTCIILGMGCLLLGSLLLVITRPGTVGIPVAQLVIGAIFLVAGGLSLFIGIWRRSYYNGFKLYLYRHGVQEVLSGRTTTAFFEDAQILTYAIVRVFSNGVYVGTVEKIGIETALPEPKSLYFQRKLLEANPHRPAESTEIERLVQEIAKLLARRMAKLIETGERLDWTSRMTLSRNGLEIKPASWWEKDLGDILTGKSHSERVAWDQIEEIRIENGVFSLRIQGQAKPAVKVFAASPNFYPGYAILLAARQGGQRALRELASEL
jgi:hypothetical protein